MKRNALRAAFPYTVPILFGYLFLGTGFGILLTSKGFSPWLAILMSAVIYAGSMQYVSISMLTGGASLISTVLMTLSVNARHLFYGLSMLDKFRPMKRTKPYLIFALTDETYSLLCGTKAPDGVDETWFTFFIALLDHLYWIIGSAIGGIASSVLTISTKGIDFVMTALFVVIFTEQWEQNKDHRPALIGAGATLLCLFLFGPQNFIVAAMVLILILLSLIRRALEGGRNV